MTSTARQYLQKYDGFVNEQHRAVQEARVVDRQNSVGERFGVFGGLGMIDWGSSM